MQILFQANRMMIPSSSPQSGYGENKGMLVNLHTTFFLTITINIVESQIFKEILDK